VRGARVITREQLEQRLLQDVGVVVHVDEPLVRVRVRVRVKVRVRQIL